MDPAIMIMHGEINFNDMDTDGSCERSDTDKFSEASPPPISLHNIG